jgi:C1A family cysteine protease
MRTENDNQRSFGWIKDKEDKLDYKYSDIQASVSLPSEGSVKSLFPFLPYDQGHLGSCVGQATAALMSAAYIKQDLPDPILSRLMIYYNARALEGVVSEDSGCTPRDAIKCAAKQGVCLEELWPYLIEKFADKPTLECYTNALNHQILSYYSVLPNLTSIKTCITEGYPFSLGIMVYENYPRETPTGDFPMPNGEQIGGHDIVAIGYSDITQKVIIRNSWGEAWGNGGYGTLPYDYITPELIGDLWTIRMVETPKSISTNDGCFTSILRLLGLVK